MLCSRRTYILCIWRMWAVSVSGASSVSESSCGKLICQTRLWFWFLGSRWVPGICWLSVVLAGIFWFSLVIEGCWHLVRTLLVFAIIVSQAFHQARVNYSCRICLVLIGCRESWEMPFFVALGRELLDKHPCWGVLSGPLLLLRIFYIVCGICFHSPLYRILVSDRIRSLRSRNML